MQARIKASVATIADAGLLTLQPIVFHEDPAIAGAYWDARKALIPMVGAVREAGTSVLLEDVAGLHTHPLPSTRAPGPTRGAARQEASWLP